MRATGEFLNGVSGIYAVIHRDSGMCYVGSSVNMAIRRQSHLNSAKRGSRSLLHRALREFGADAFDFEVLERCHRHDLLSREGFYIALLNAASLDGLNVLKTPSACYGITPSKSTRERQRAAKLGKPLTLEHRLKLRGVPRRKRPPFTAEHRAKLKSSASHRTTEQCAKYGLHNKGCKLSAEHRAAITAGLTGRKLSDESRARMSAAQKLSMTPERRAHLSRARKGWNPSEATRAKMSEAGKNRTPISDETRKRMCVAAKARAAKALLARCG